MKSTPRTKSALIALFVVLGVVDILVYWNVHLCTEAEKAEDSQKRLEILHKARKVYPLDDRVFYQMGKIYFVSGIRKAGENVDAGALIGQSAESFRRSLDLNPCSPFGHFYYGQALEYEGLFTPSAQGRFDKEYRSAAELAGENRELLYEAGKRLLVRWKDLTAEERDFVLTILGRALEWKPEDKFAPLMPIWEMNVGDIGAMERIMPSNPQVYTALGNFLGEKSLSLADRHRLLSRADILYFRRAESLLEEGKREFDSAKYREARKLLTYCLGHLMKIRFFARLSGEYPIDEVDYSRLYATDNLYLGLSILESGGEFEEAAKYLHRFLDAEEGAAALEELASYVQQHGIADLALQVHLYHRQGRCGDIVKIGDRIREGRQDGWKIDRGEISRMFYFLGDAFLEEERFEEAVEYFQKSLEADPRHLESWVGLRQIYRRLEQPAKIREVEERIARLLAPVEMVFSDLVLSKNREFSRGIILEGKRMCLDIYFEGEKKDLTPLITVEFNGKVVCDEFPKEGGVSFPVETEMGENILVIRAVNHPLVLRRVAFEVRAD
jgi:tetratricopeptide (TPR) repeat protein